MLANKETGSIYGDPAPQTAVKLQGAGSVWHSEEFDQQ